ncbi:aconitase X swivel domain-containing protein [Prauserella oleivorans]|uniref:Aconitase X swivel domain-containing protein n=1 Tax=Prauserella oleivorans TaxID=1478153 RepID=A0ABW5WEV3_9PSEU
MQQLVGPIGFGEVVEARALVSTDAFSARYDLDHTTGVISRRSHDLFGESVAGRVLVVPTAKGGTATGWRLLDLRSRGLAPAALLLRTTNPVLVQGAVFAGIPIMHRLDVDPVRTIRTGQLVRVVPYEGRVEALDD